MMFLLWGLLACVFCAATLYTLARAIINAWSRDDKEDEL